MINDEIIPKLIEEVRAHPSLYTRSHVDYKNSCKRNLIWEQITNAFIEEGHHVTNDYLRAKWKSICDYYRKYLKKEASGTASPAALSWKYFHDLHSFLASEVEHSVRSKMLQSYQNEIDIDYKRPRLSKRESPQPPSLFELEQEATSLSPAPPPPVPIPEPAQAVPAPAPPTLRKIDPIDTFGEFVAGTLKQRRDANQRYQHLIKQITDLLYSDLTL